jgi:dTDP-4-amino-4,6-dideoxygalactose transaminase
MDSNREPIHVLKPVYVVDECLDEIRKCLVSGWTGSGGKTIEFEEAWKKYTGLPHAHFLNSATAGLHLAIKILKGACDWKEGDEIITTPLTFVSTNHAILYEGLFPVFADIHPLTLCLDPQSIEDKITIRTRAIMYVGVGGSPGHLDQVRDICKRHNLKLILDAAHMAGTKMRRRNTYEHVGKEADVTVFSFQSVKNLPTADGGMICFQDAEFDARARKLSWLGIDKNTFLRSSQSGTYKWKYDVLEVGNKMQGNAVIASIGLVQLKYLDKDNEYRQQLFNLYESLLQDNSKITIINHCGPHQLSRHLCQILIPQRDYVLSRLNNYDIFPGVHYISNLHYKMYRYAYGTCPVAEEKSCQLLSLPLHLKLNESDITYVSKHLLEILKDV